MNIHDIRMSICVLAALLLAGGCASSATKFDTPDAAVDSFVTALRAKNTSELKKIFGPESEKIIASGDPVADQNQVEKFLAAYDASHHLQSESDGVTTTLIVGKQDWPFPVPLVRTNDRKYFFDTAAGEDEILNRRIGRNELATQQVCLAIVDAQLEYTQRNPMGSQVREYAQKLTSDPGKKNGLFWPTAEGEPPSPMGAMVAEASQEGYTRRNKNEPAPAYHGYYYKLLTSQGPHAEGGEAEYLIDNRLIGGFGVLAYPALYGNSGIKTFIINHDGVLYEQDLGPDTSKIAKGIQSFDPGPEWTKSDVPAPTPEVASKDEN
jgi:hypothetical protein